MFDRRNQNRMKRLFYLLFSTFILVLLTSCSPKKETEKLICAEAEMTSFPYSAGGLKVTKHQTVTPVEGVEGLEVIEWNSGGSTYSVRLS